MNYLLYYEQENRIGTYPNLYFYNKMMEEIRDAIDEGRFHSYKEEKLYGIGQINREKEKQHDKKKINHKII